MKFYSLIRNIKIKKKKYWNNKCCTKWKELYSITLTEICLSQKDKYCTFYFICIIYINRDYIYMQIYVCTHVYVYMYICICMKVDNGL